MTPEQFDALVDLICAEVECGRVRGSCGPHVREAREERDLAYSVARRLFTNG